MIPLAWSKGLVSSTAHLSSCVPFFKLEALGVTPPSTHQLSHGEPMFPTSNPSTRPLPIPIPIPHSQNINTSSSSITRRSSHYDDEGSLREKVRFAEWMKAEAASIPPPSATSTIPPLKAAAIYSQRVILTSMFLVIYISTSLPFPPTPLHTCFTMVFLIIILVSSLSWPDWYQSDPFGLGKRWSSKARSGGSQQTSQQPENQVHTLLIPCHLPPPYQKLIDRWMLTFDQSSETRLGPIQGMHPFKSSISKASVGDLNTVWLTMIAWSSYCIYKALATAIGAINPNHRPDYTNVREHVFLLITSTCWAFVPWRIGTDNMFLQTEPPFNVAPNPSWYDPARIVSMDPWGHLTPQIYKSYFDAGVDIRPTGQPPLFTLLRYLSPFLIGLNFYFFSGMYKGSSQAGRARRSCGWGSITDRWQDRHQISRRLGWSFSWNCDQSSRWKLGWNVTRRSPTRGCQESRGRGSCHQSGGWTSGEDLFFPVQFVSHQYCTSV